MKTFLLLFLILTPSIKALASREFPYSSLVRVPAVQSTCDLEAQVLQNKISNNAGVSNVKVECRGPISLVENNITYKLYSLAVDYTSEMWVRYAADFRVDQLRVPRGYTYPAYHSYGECVRDLEIQKTIFERETKLEAIIASCEDLGFSYETKYVIKIESFGTPEKKLQYVDIGVNPTTDPLLFLEVERLITEQNISIVKQFDQIEFFYSSKPVTLQKLGTVFFKDLSQCESQIEEGKLILTRSGSTKVIAKCFPSLGSAEMRVFGIGSNRYLPPYPSSTIRYYTYDECMQDRSRLIAKYSDSIFGLICAPEVGSRDRYFAYLYK